MNMTKKRVAELEGAQLDWAVCVAEDRPPESFVYLAGYHPSQIWAEGGTIIQRERIGINWWAMAHLEPKAAWRAVMPSGYTQRGPTPLIAAMRAFVASKLGDEVEVPE